MTADRRPIYLESLVRELCQLPHETEWAEFKVDNADPQELGEYLSALANAAALSRKAFAYVLWGVEDTAHRVVGTTFSPATARKGNEALESWLLRLLQPQVEFRFTELGIDGQRVVLLEIAAAASRPVRFAGTEFIRVGSYTRSGFRTFQKKSGRCGAASEALSYLRGTRQRHRQGSRCHGIRVAAATPFRAATRLHSRHALGLATTDGDGQRGTCPRVLPPRGADVPSGLVSDERFDPRAVRHQLRQPRHCVAANS